ncbi:transketolase (plasmid) [Azospirillum sp. 412522]|nr:transketolase C-terminal domain-containing protein [Azospirillum sp. 412522]MBY6266469.1 transketolase [Azospirillum sp. 412522]
MRNAFAKEVTRLASADERVVLLSGDIGNNLFEGVKKVGSRHFLNCGIAEANMIGVAAGMAMSGLRPIVYTIAPFTTTRCFEQIRVDLCYHEAPVIIVGTGAGLSYAELGPTHHSLEDLAILRTLPNMTVFAPCDIGEMVGCMRAALAHDGPSYIRIGKKGEPDIHPGEVDLVIGKAIEVQEGHDVALLVSGTIMPVALAVSAILKEQGLSVAVTSFPTVKPLDTDYLEQTASGFRLLVTIEEHGRIGGLGGAVSEWRAGIRNAPPVLLCGTRDEFLHVIGDQDYARSLYMLSADKIAATILEKLG